ncbi:MAG: hypothetical protein SF066_21475 [Thermoanaerobaculia bacterium]|nr:hypothetical protein [Thermoanaerobaculia bacterium]
MSDLFFAELRRFRSWALAAAVLHLTVLGFLTRMVDLAQQPLVVYRAFGAVYFAIGLLLGLYQMGSYRRPNTWLQLLHRPVPPWRIALELATACLVLLAAAIGGPILITAGGQELWTARVVDFRHFLLAPAASLLAGCGYLAGAYTLLAGRRWGILVLVLPALLAVSTAGGVGALVMQLLVLLALGGLVLIAFEPERGRTPRRPLALAATALPVMVGVLITFRFAGFLFEMGWILAGSHPLNSTPPPGGYVEATRADGKALLAAGIGPADDELRRQLHAEVRLSEVHALGRLYEREPRRNELTNPAPMEFDDAERRVRWVFSHDSGRFHGVRLTDGGAHLTDHGDLGAGADGTPFPTPALPFGDGLVATTSTVYQYDSVSQRLWPRLAVPAPEVLAGAALAPVGDHVAVFSDRALYFYDAREFGLGQHLVPARLRLPMPGPAGELVRIDLIERLDGYLVSFLYGAGALDGRARPFQEVVLVDGQGAVQVLPRRELPVDGPAAWHHLQFWPSPVLNALAEGAETLFAAPSPLLATAPPPRPVALRLLALGLCLLSLVLAFLRSRRLPLSPAARWGWLAACGLFGLPALVTLFLLHPAPERWAPAPAATPALA